MSFLRLNKVFHQYSMICFFKDSNEYQLEDRRVECKYILSAKARAGARRATSLSSSLPNPHQENLEGRKDPGGPMGPRIALSQPNYWSMMYSRPLSS